MCSCVLLVESESEVMCEFGGVVGYTHSTLSELLLAHHGTRHKMIGPMIHGNIVAKLRVLKGKQTTKTSAITGHY